MKKYIYISTAFLLFSCSPLILVQPSENDAARASQKFPGTTLEELNQGKTFFEANCSKCHSLKKPFKVSEEKLNSIVPKMAKKAKLDDKTENLILKYLVTMNSVQNKK